jgi:hypothetical protein
MITIDQIDSAISSVEIKTSAGVALDIDSNGYITVKGNGDFNVTATDLDIRDLTSASDSVEIKTAAGQALSIDGSGYLTVNQGSSPWVVTVGNVSTWKNTVETPSNVAAELVSTPLTNRSSILIQNVGTQDVYIGPDNAVTVSNGVKIPKGSSAEFSFDTGADIYAITNAGTGELRVSEFAA